TARLEKAINQRVTIEFSDDLADSLALLGLGREVIVIGDQSLVAHGAKVAGLKCHAVCELTDSDGATTLSASFIVRSDDAVKELKEIGGREVLFGLAEADAKQAAGVAALRAVGVKLPAKLETRASFNDAALDMLDSSSSPP